MSKILDRARSLGLIVHDTKRGLVHGFRRHIVIASSCGTVWSSWMIKPDTPLCVYRQKIHDWQVLCDNIENNSITIKRA